MQMIHSQLQKELQNYMDSSVKFTQYYPNMNIVVSDLYNEQLKNVLDSLEQEEQGSSKKFKLYLDTVIINMQSKIEKYKKSSYFENEKIKDIENQGFIIPFFIDEEKKIYVLLGIVKG
jgi:hypothetical protein